MADRKQFLTVEDADPELLSLLEASKHSLPSEEELREQRVSFAFGNAMGSDNITKDSVRRACDSIRLTRGH